MDTKKLTEIIENTNAMLNRDGLLYSNYMQQNIRIKQAFSILIIAFMIFSAFAIVSDHMNNEQNLRSNLNKNSVINHESQINVPESTHSALFGFNSSSYGIS